MNSYFNILNLNFDYYILLIFTIGLLVTIIDITVTMKNNVHLLITMMNGNHNS